MQPNKQWINGGIDTFLFAEGVHRKITHVRNPELAVPLMAAQHPSPSFL